VLTAAQYQLALNILYHNTQSPSIKGMPLPPGRTKDAVGHQLRKMKGDFRCNPDTMAVDDEGGTPRLPAPKRTAKSKAKLAPVGTLAKAQKAASLARAAKKRKAAKMDEDSNSPGEYDPDEADSDGSSHEVQVKKAKKEEGDEKEVKIPEFALQDSEFVIPSVRVKRTKKDSDEKEVIPKVKTPVVIDEFVLPEGLVKKAKKEEIDEKEDMPKVKTPEFVIPKVETPNAMTPPAEDEGI
jgi:hypothetical protein